MNYENAKIYAIRTLNNPDLVYVGSTTAPLHKKMYNHRQGFKRWGRGLNNNTSSVEVFKEGRAYIELIEAFPCASRQELNKRAGEIIRSMKCVNKVVPGRSDEDRKVQQRARYEAYKDRWKQYCIDNAERLALYKEGCKQWHRLKEERAMILSGTVAPKPRAAAPKPRAAAPADKLITCSCGALLPTNKMGAHLANH